MKRLISILLVAVVMLMALASCSSSDKTDWAYIEEKGTLKVGITIWKPMNYTDEDGNWTGFETEFAQEVAKKLGVKVEFVLIDWTKKTFELKSKTIDCVWNGMTVTDELLAEIDVSQSYIKNWQVLVIQKENADKYTTLESMKDAKVVAEAGSAGQKAAEADENLKNNFTSVADQKTALMEVQSGTADIAIIDYVMTLSTIGPGTDYENLMLVSGIELSAEEYAIGFRKNSPETVKKVNEAMNELISSGKLNELAEKYGIADQLISNQGVTTTD